MINEKRLIFLAISYINRGQVMYAYMSKSITHTTNTHLAHKTKN